MLASAETVKAVVETLVQYKIQNIVVDPVRS
jgi:hydroxymethylpyrimidine/phosphomethylpyrimidine kinase